MEEGYRLRTKAAHATATIGLRGNTENEAALRDVVESLMSELRSSSGLSREGHAVSTTELELLAGVAAGVPSAGGHKSGAVVRKVRGTMFRLTRWYVEPFVLQQRSFNLAAVRYIAELERRIAELEREHPSRDA